MKIAIIGAGIGGLTTALALQQHGFEPHLYEAATEIWPVGKGIWLPTNAMLVMDRLGLGDLVAAKGLALQSIELRGISGDLLQNIDLDRVKQRYGRTTTSILRADLQATLAQAIPADRIHLNKRCLSVRQTEGSAIATFADGSQIEADIIVGADGIRSIVREAVQPDVKLRYSGQTCYLGVADLKLPTASMQRVQEIWGGRARFGYSAVSEDRIYWFAPLLAPAGGPIAEKLQTHLQSIYHDFPDVVTKILNHTTPDEIIKVDLHDFAPIDQWFHKRIVLIGDAAHAMTPNVGQGGAQAIEDALALAISLKQYAAPEKAFAHYQAMRQAKAKRIVMTAWRLGQLAHWTSPWQRKLRNFAFKLTPEKIKQQQVEALYSLGF